MRQKSILSLIIILILIAFSIHAFAEETKVVVTVKKASLKEKPMSFGKTVTTVYEDNELIVIEEQGSWIKVKTIRGEEGWINKSAVSERKTFSSSGGFVTKTSTATGATAKASISGASSGKFSSSVLESFSEQEEVDLSIINEIENIQKNKQPEENQSFREEGDLGEFQ